MSQRAKHYDYLVVGAGFFGATAARRLADGGKRVLVIDQAAHVAGKAHTVFESGQLYQPYGGHIFHTNEASLWEWVCRFGDMRQYSHHVKALAGGQVYSLPINLNTLAQLWPDSVAWSPARAQTLFRSLQDQARAAGLQEDNVRDWCLANIGPTLYGLLIEGYTTKQWGRSPETLPASIIRRLPVRSTWNDHYFSDAYQGLPVRGYMALVENMLTMCDLRLEVDYLDRTTYWDSLADRTIYTGPLDRLYGYQLGHLEWRSLRFEHTWQPVADWQGCPTLNYCDRETAWLRDEEWRHWWPSVASGFSLVTRTWPDATGEPLYPINDQANQALYESYATWAARRPNLLIGGRLGSYRYLDMHQAIGAALKLADSELAKG